MLIDVTVFTSRLYDFVLLINFFVQICLMGTLFITSLYLQNVLRYDAFSTGLTLMPLSIVSPTRAAINITVSTAFSVIFYKEKLRFRQLAGIVMGIAAVVLLNLKI